MNEKFTKSQLEKGIRDLLVDTTDKPEDVNLTLKKDDFVIKMRKEEKGEELLELLEIGESNICERMGLCHGYIKDGVVYFDVPSWANLVGHLTIVNSV